MVKNISTILFLFVVVVGINGCIGSSNDPEICTNGIDDNDDGIADCLDFDCSITDECIAAQTVIDQDIIETYLTDSSLTSIKTASGLHYIVTNVGTGSEMPSLDDSVLVGYKGYLLDGTVFDQTIDTSSVRFLLSSTILGWQEGLQLMKREETATLIIPSALAYGRAGVLGFIPPYAVIAYDIELFDF